MVVMCGDDECGNSMGNDALFRCSALMGKMRSLAVIGETEARSVWRPVGSGRIACQHRNRRLFWKIHTFVRFFNRFIAFLMIFAGLWKLIKMREI